ncbi:GNAT family N-acetyltransferase [Planomonospora sp. ID91781]|uniref:GNAT family N-acetyltransferase n=1 Tax=Planomonospora sp. ID91781 TaxID=2738135 RepID=UPI0018C3CF40|nr:GNAT family N-acetyltransferase [Planomonospora sp. ID91781]MBG0819980.1 GNAT family N-acetyltransferase [Planomonospora sp. ID91781]
MSHSCHRHDAADTSRLSADIIALYERCYGVPPWSETPEQLRAYPARLAQSLTRPGFTAWTTRDNDRLTGACYGWPTPADLTGNHLYEAIIGTLGPNAACLLMRDAFEVAELFVHPDARGRGLGRALLSAATAGRPATWLITSPDVPAARLYQRLGWRQIALLPAGLYPQLPLAVFSRAGTTRHGDHCVPV